MIDDARRWVGKGNQSVPGKPFGWAWNMERRALRDHLRRRGRYAAEGYDALGEDRVGRIQDRLRRYEPTYAERCAARNAANPPRPPVEQFNAAELERIVEHFTGSNDELGELIAVKARAMALNSPIH